MLDGDVLLAVLPKRRQILSHPIGKLQVAALGENHQRGCGCDGLGQRGQVEDRIHRHRRFLRRLAAQAVHLTKNDVATVNDKHNGSRQLLAANGVFDGRVNRGEMCLLRLDAGCGELSAG